MSNIIMRSLPAVAMTLGEKMGIEVIVGGHTAATNGNTIFIPELPEDEKLYIKARGYIDHESAHIKDTNFNVWPKNDPTHAIFTNIIEDVRVEKMQGERYPGCAYNLRMLSETMAAEGSFTAKDTDPGDLFQAWLLTNSRDGYLGQHALKDIADDAEKRLRPLVGDQLMDKARKLLGDIPNLKDTADSVKLAKKIMDLISNPGGGGGGGNDKGGQGDQPGGEGGKGAEQTQKQKENSQKILKSKSKIGDIGKHVADQLSSNSNSQNGVGCYPGEMNADNLNLRNIDVNGIRKKTTGLRVKMARLIAAKKLRRNYTKRSGTHISSRDIHRLAIADTRVFHAKEERKAVNTAVAILVDRSGSMSGERMSRANEASFAIADALDKIPGVVCTVGAFPAQSTKVFLIKPFEKTANQVSKNFGIGASGGTPMKEAIYWARTKMMVRQEPRKIVMVITDGEPAEPDKTKITIKKLEEEGIEFMGIGIQMRVSHLFKNSATITNVTELSEKMFKMFTESLTRNPNAG